MLFAHNIIEKESLTMGQNTGSNFDNRPSVFPGAIDDPAFEQEKRRKDAFSEVDVLFSRATASTTDRPPDPPRSRIVFIDEEDADLAVTAGEEAFEILTKAAIVPNPGQQACQVWELPCRPSVWFEVEQRLSLDAKQALQRRWLPAVNRIMLLREDLRPMACERMEELLEALKPAPDVVTAIVRLLTVRDHE